MTLTERGHVDLFAEPVSQEGVCREYRKITRTSDSFGGGSSPQYPHSGSLLFGAGND